MGFVQQQDSVEELGRRLDSGEEVPAARFGRGGAIRGRRRRGQSAAGEAAKGAAHKGTGGRRGERRENEEAAAKKRPIWALLACRLRTPFCSSGARPICKQGNQTARFLHLRCGPSPSRDTKHALSECLVVVHANTETECTEAGNWSKKHSISTIFRHPYPSVI